jgi:RHS repeat-associated protein
MYDIHPLAERHEQRHLALRTVENCFSRLELQRSKSQKIEYFYDLQDRMLTYGDNTYTYTVNGSLLTKTNAEGVTEYSYDAMGNLLRVVLPDNRVITYQIDARGRRIGKKVDGVFEYGFIYGNQLNPIAKVDEAGNIVEQYVYGLKSNIPEYIIKDGKKYKIVSNHLGSPVMIVGGQAQDLPVLQIKYDSFGNIIEENGDFEIPFGFAGGIWDKDTKLTRFGVRDYDAETGRWTSKEPLGFGGSRNFYVYAGNDGVNYVDLDGLKITRTKYRIKNGSGIPGYSRGKDIAFYEEGVSDLTLAIKAAINFMNTVICASIKDKKEYGIPIYQSTSGAMHPNDSYSRIGTINSITNSVSSNTLLTVHLHIVDGRVYGEDGSVTCYSSEGFSEDDISDAKLNNVAAAIGTVNGNVYIFIPAYNRLFFSEEDVFIDLGKQLNLSKCICPIKNGNKGESCGQ